MAGTCDIDIRRATQVEQASGVDDKNYSGGFGCKTYECRPRETETDPASLLDGNFGGLPGRTIDA